MTKINISKIIRDYLFTFRNYSSGKISFSDLFLFFVSPLILSLPISYFSDIPTNLLNYLIIVFSILTLFLPTLMNSFPAPVYADRLGRILIKEIISAVFFNILILISLIAVSVIIIIVGLNIVLETIFYYLVFVFLLNLLMLLKRSYILKTRI